jgi:hypothetical protein
MTLISRSQNQSLSYYILFLKIKKNVVCVLGSQYGRRIGICSSHGVLKKQELEKLKKILSQIT